MERSTMFNGKTHYFDWAIFNSYVKLPEGNGDWWWMISSYLMQKMDVSGDSDVWSVMLFCYGIL